MFFSFVRSKTPKVVSNLVEFFVFFYLAYLFIFFFFVLCLNCVFLHLIRGNYLLLCLGFASALTLIYMSMRVWRINCLICFCVELQKKYINTTKKNFVDQVKRKQIYIGKKSRKRRIQQKKGRVQHNFYCNFISGLLIFTCNQSFS